MKHVLLVLLAFFAINSVTAQTPCSNKGFTAAMAPMAGYPLRVAVTNTNNISLPANSYGYLLYNWGDNGTPGYANLPAAAAGSTVYHNYASPGVYTIWQHVFAYDSVMQSNICTDSISQQFTVFGAPCAATISHAVSLNNFTFTANNISSTPGLTYSWNFGDGSTAVGNPVSHTYATIGNFTVTLTTSAPAPASCNSTTNKLIYNSWGPPPPPTLPSCNSLMANFTPYVNIFNVNFYNSSSYIASPAYRTYLWNFGDGSTSTATSPNHTYATTGTYSVKLVTKWMSNATTLWCIDSVTKIVNITGPANRIDGYIMIDSLDYDTSMAFKVWLIEHDTLANTLTAVDSQWAVPQGYYAFYYQFDNKAAGNYLTKAHLTNGPASGTGYIPTYHTSSLYWSSATNISHNGGSTDNKHINMQKGTITSGPGFVGGNISQGANKGTSGGLANMLVIIRDNSTMAVRSTFTDGNGNYSVSNLPVGTYSIYPEDMGYSTTPAPVTITANKPSVIDIDFERSHSTMSIQPKATGIDGINAANLFAVYPNPANGIVYIRSAQNLAGAKVNVTDITGRTIQSVILGSHTDNKLDVSTLQNGLYYVTIQANEITHTEKIMILH